MTNKLVVFINNLNVSKIKKILLYEMKFLVPNYSCLQNPWLGGYRPQIPVFSVLNWICWTPPPRTIFLGTPLVEGNDTSFLCHCLHSWWFRPGGLRSSGAQFPEVLSVPRYPEETWRCRQQVAEERPGRRSWWLRRAVPQHPRPLLQRHIRLPGSGGPRTAVQPSWWVTHSYF